MLEIIKTLLAAPLVSILVVMGILFLLLAVAGQVPGFKVAKERQKWAAIIGGSLVFSGLALLVLCAPCADCPWCPRAPPEDTPSPPPTETDTPTSTSTSGPTATLTPIACAVTPTGRLGDIWDVNATVRSGLHCPTSVQLVPYMVEQPFEHGRMFWREDKTLIYVMYDNYEWDWFPDTWKSGEDPYSCEEEAPPSGLSQPVRGFGRVWCTEPGVKERVAWATREERPMEGTVQEFEGGVGFEVPGLGVFVLYSETDEWEQH